MMTARLMAAFFGSAFINLNMTTCQSPGEGDPAAPDVESSPPARVQLDGVDTSELSPREQARWSAHVSELLAPCEDTPVSVAQCVQEKRACAACLPAAEYLVDQVRQGKTAGQVDKSYKERFSSDSIIEIDLSGSPSKGAPAAPITLVEFADFECGVCKATSEPLNDFVKANDDVRLVFKNYPLGFHENAEGAARASVAADRQGKFWEMHKALFASHNLTETALVQMAKDLGLNVEQFKKDLRSEDVADAVTRDRKQGEAAKVTGTPSIFINGRRFTYTTDLKTGLADWLKVERRLIPASKGKPSQPSKQETASKNSKPDGVKPDSSKLQGTPLPKEKPVLTKEESTSGAPTPSSGNAAAAEEKKQ